MIVTRDLILAVLVVALGATGTYLLLPHRLGTATPRRVHIAGGVLAGLALLLFAAFWKPPGPLLAGFFFYGFSFAAVAAAVLTITSRNPIYSALWFAAVVLASSGLFMLAGAQFLAAGTVIVYAGAIIVTFLFVIMLAQMEGRAPYDRAARAPARATFSCFLLFWGLLYALLAVRSGPELKEGVAHSDQETRITRTGRIPDAYQVKPDSPTGRVVRASTRDTLMLDDPQGRRKPHVAGLGASLYTDHLIVVELAGSLLFAALIGALAIATPKRPVRPGDSPAAPEAGVPFGE